MTRPITQWFATAAFIAALSTAVAIVAPQLFAAQPMPTVEPIPVGAPTETVDLAALDGAVDMTHWQETAAPVTPYIPGKDRKGK